MWWNLTSLMHWDAPCSTHGQQSPLQTSVQSYLIHLPVCAIANKLHQLKDSRRILGEKEERPFNKAYFDFLKNKHSTKRSTFFSNVLSGLSFSDNTGISSIAVTRSRVLLIHPVCPSHPCTALCLRRKEHEGWGWPWEPW